MTAAPWVLAALTALRIGPQNRVSCLPPKHHIIEVPALLFGDQRHRRSAGGCPDLPALLCRALAFSVLVVIDQQNKLPHMRQHRQTSEPALGHGRPCWR